MKVETLPVIKGENNLPNYDEAYANFNWEEVNKNFTWNETGRVNMAYEAIDKHAKSDRKNKVALYYQDGSRKEKYTFKEMKDFSNKAGNVLKNYGDVEKGDRVFIFMPRSPELYFALLGAVKLGAIVGPLFEAFMEGAVRDRLEDSEAKVLITTPELLERVPLNDLPALKTVFLVGDNVEEGGKTVAFNPLFEQASKELHIEWLGREDGLILHYTSGSTGKPKGVLHAQNAMVQHYQTAKWVLDLKEDDVYWCTADPGWVTGTAYGIFAPWLVGASNVILGGRFSPEAWYEALQDYGVTVWYSAPTAFRMLMGAGQDAIKKYDLSQVRHVLSVGEPLNPEVIRWGMNAFGLRIHDTWWMTETGGQVICNYPCMEIRPGSMGKPIPGVKAAIVDNEGNEVPPYTMGNLAIAKGWPSMMRGIWNNEQKYESYFMPGDWYVSGDSAYMDEDGYFWFQGRIDDVIMTSGERVGPFEVESKLIEHAAVAEAGVIGIPDPVRGEIIKAFIALRAGYEPSDELKEEIRQFVKKGLAAHAAPRQIEFRDKLPKTRSGKIMRRVLKAWELNLPTGDLSTMED
ncbi:TPA: acetate--CoA ligase [Bacillus thuringiensis]|uniref:acetate--CoA ligase n=3 Tax=Bacillus cereus group TaxID=86661 RepID=A0A9X6KUR2_BACTU|nr:MULTISPECIES: acetate--CoA ligase [Bacillus cereus group]AGE80543.1 Acetyl-coenzyme A synthetase [Bacillus thuringiensis serovar kurstaki str. HD73]AHZ53503.1 acetyl-CoA synthetase [Bacillus thuringiensis serovar kurstaki str. YBT-1520]AIM29679.1 acetyl-coenzyme A synthetase [Bacillus thuringiensis serovar kurstaki str. YBT-1520]AJA21851.1 acetyl-CoA synthetase [Bacillus thuringiensis serovar galleriae]AJK41639.1 AMP-binding enzyme family protein [Bacillus thuringiensis serovar kurstaki]